MEIEDYIILSKESKLSLNREIKEYSRKGYQLEGFSATVDKYNCAEFHQVMVKYKNKKKDSL